MSYERPLETGAIAYLNGNSDHTIAFRADIDALPIFENDVDYRSQTDNVMHACGHDGHTTALMLFVKRCKEMFDKGTTSTQRCIHLPTCRRNWWRSESSN